MNAGPLPVWPLPDPLAQPGPTWLFGLLLLVTFVAHLLAMDVMVGGALIGAVARLRHRRRRQAALHGLAASLATLMPPAIATTVTLGVAPLLFVQVLFGRALFTTSALIAWWWLAVVPILIAAYYASYWLSFRARGGHEGGEAASWAVCLLLVAIGFVYVNNMSLTWRADRFATLYRDSAAGLHLNLADPTLVPRFLHMMLGAVAIGGMAVAVLGLFRRHRDPPEARWLVRHGAWWFTVATAVNLLAGTWWLLALPRETLIGFMRDDPAAALALALGVIVSFAPLALMALAIQMDRPWRAVKVSAWLAAASVALMALTRDQLRRSALASHGFEPQPWIATEWGPVACFGLLLAVALATIWWMLRALAAGVGAEEPRR